MSDPVVDLDQRLRAPLAGFHGAPPPAPAWFREAIARAPERHFTEVEGARIETLIWGERGRPGLLFLHGGMANADWFDHMAPVFADDWRVAAMSMSGMGRSDWRARYDIGQLAREMVAVGRAAGLYEAGAPVFVAHSLGSRPLIRAAADPALAPRAGVILDAAVSAPDRPDLEPPPPRPRRVHPSLEAAIARFRLMPYQACENLFILDHIARHSAGETIGEHGAPGWSWRFDPEFIVKLDGVQRAKTDAALRAALCPLAVIYGDRSAIVRADNLAYTRSIAPAGTPFVPVSDAAHHLFLDQPQATVAALKDVLAGFGP
jgi:pimeloyl-ACP methyl ester carboxylesterase